MALTTSSKPRKLRRGLWFSETTGTWHYEVRREGVKHAGDTGHPLEKGARLWLARKITQLKDAEVGLVPPEAWPTLAEALQGWLRVRSGVSSPGHVANVARAVRLHAAPLHATPVDQITPHDLETLRAAYMKGRGQGSGGAKLPHSEGGANKAIFHLRLVLTWALRRPAPALPPLAAQEAVKGILWPEDVQGFLAEAWKGGRDHATTKARLVPHSVTAICLMIGLGLRETEALTARIEWWDRRRGVYIVGRSKSRYLREIPLPDWLTRHLTALLTLQGHPTKGLLLPAGLDKQGRQVPHERLFTTKPVARCAQALKITGLTPHRLRATFATAHFENGTTLSQIQQMLGHRDPQTTMRYIVQRPKDQAKAQERVAQAMGFEANPPTVLPPRTKGKLTQTKKAKPRKQAHSSQA